MSIPDSNRRIEYFRFGGSKGKDSNSKNQYGIEYYIPIIDRKKFDFSISDICALSGRQLETTDVVVLAQIKDMTTDSSHKMYDIYSYDFVGLWERFVQDYKDKIIICEVSHFMEEYQDKFTIDERVEALYRYIALLERVGFRNITSSCIFKDALMFVYRNDAALTIIENAIRHEIHHFIYEEEN